MTPIWKPSTVSRAGVRLGESDVEITGLGDNALRDGSNGDVVGRFRLELNLKRKRSVTKNAYRFYH